MVNISPSDANHFQVGVSPIVGIEFGSDVDHLGVPHQATTCKLPPSPTTALFDVSTSFDASLSPTLFPSLFLVTLYPFLQASEPATSCISQFTDGVLFLRSQPFNYARQSHCRCVRHYDWHCCRFQSRLSLRSHQVCLKSEQTHCCYTPLKQILFTQSTQSNPADIKGICSSHASDIQKALLSSCPDSDKSAALSAFADTCKDAGVTVCMYNFFYIDCVAA
jgi:hypothetical protein